MTVKGFKVDDGTSADDAPTETPETRAPAYSGAAA